MSLTSFNDLRDSDPCSSAPAPCHQFFGKKAKKGLYSRDAGLCFQFCLEAVRGWTLPEREPRVGGGEIIRSVMQDTIVPMGSTPDKA